MLKGPPDTFPAVTMPTADFCHDGLSLRHVPGAFYLHHSLSCVCRCCLTWLSVRLLTQIPIVPTYSLMSGAAYPLFFFLCDLAKSVWSVQVVSRLMGFQSVIYCFDIVLTEGFLFFFFWLTISLCLSCLSSNPSSRRLPCRRVPVSDGRPVHSHALALRRGHGLHGLK